MIPLQGGGTVKMVKKRQQVFRRQQGDCSSLVQDHKTERKAPVMQQTLLLEGMEYQTRGPAVLQWDGRGVQIVCGSHPGTIFSLCLDFLRRFFFGAKLTMQQHNVSRGLALGVPFQTSSGSPWDYQVSTVIKDRK